MDMTVKRVLPPAREKAEELAELIADLQRKGQDEAFIAILEEFLELKKKARAS